MDGACWLLTVCWLPAGRDELGILASIDRLFLVVFLTGSRLVSAALSVG